MPNQLFRVLAMSWSAALAILSGWLLAPAIADAVSRERTDPIYLVHTAASLGVIRGDLWSNYAAQLAQPALARNKIDDFDSQREALRYAAERTVALSPHDSRAWLILAALNARVERIRQDSSGFLKMSYYTGPVDPRLIPLRLGIVTQTQAINDADVRILAERDVRTAVSRRPELRQDLKDDYRAATPQGRQYLEVTIARFDPSFAAELRASTP